jgi:hypothetical protein
MTAAVIENSDKLFAVKLRGQLKKAEFERLQAAAAQAAAQSGYARILIDAEQFDGWERDKGWGDVSFMMEHDADAGKIAVVAEERWRDDMLLFLGAGLRKAEVAFFTPDERGRARAWLGG